MKRILIVVSSLFLNTQIFGAPLHANPSGLVSCAAAERADFMQLCNRMVTENGLNQCVAEARGHFELCAINQCNRMTTEAGLLAGIRAMKNRTYHEEDMNACSRMTTENGLATCLSSAGEPYRSSSSSRLKDRLNRVLDMLYDNNISRAKDELNDIIREM